MFRLMIVDDEEIIRESLKNLIDWASLGIEIVSICKNSLEAYDSIIDEYPDIILTDIQMPGYSGLTLIERLTSEQTDIEFIILSGYDDFSYAKEAMKYGVKYYLLKPCDDIELINAVNAIKKSLDSKDRPRFSYTTNKPFINDLLIYINDHYMDSDLTLKKVAETELFISTNYVSKHFQIEMGIKFSTYLNQLRMKKAIDLLKHHHLLKIYEVAEKVGCGNNPQYFSQLFKKHTGLSPKQFISKL